MSHSEGARTNIICSNCKSESPINYPHLILESFLLTDDITTRFIKCCDDLCTRILDSKAWIQVEPLVAEYSALLRPGRS